MRYTETVQRLLKVEPCLRCGSTDVRISDCGYTSFNCGNVCCVGCGYKVDVPGGADSDRQYIDYWNGERQRREAERAKVAARLAELDALLGG